MTIQEEESYLWLFESHNNSKRSQWLKSTLSELEEKTKGMMKLIECDADTFAQRAEMYYKKRPELVNMIEDFYRSYRSLAERYDQLKLESGSSFSNRGYLHKEWSSIDKSSAASSVTFDSESEVDDPPEEDQEESNAREVPGNKDGNITGIKRERSDVSAYTVDSELSEVGYPVSEETEVESKLEESPHKKSIDIYVVKQMIEKVEVGAEKCNVHPESVYGNQKERRSSLSNLTLMIEEADRTRSKIGHMEAKSSESLEDKHEIEEAKLMSEVERLKEENTSFKAELERKDEEKREVIRQLSSSLDILKGENDGMRKFIRDSKNRSSLCKFRQLKSVFAKKLFGTRSEFPTTPVAL